MSEERKQDLIDNEHERAQAAIMDLARFVRQHGCMPSFDPDGAVRFFFNTEEEEIEHLAQRVEQRWAYEMFDGVESRKDFFAQGASPEIQEQTQIQERLNKVVQKLGPAGMLELMAGLGSGANPEELIAQLEERAAHIEEEDAADEADPTRLLSNFDIASVINPEPRDEDEALGMMFGDDDDDDDDY